MAAKKQAGKFMILIKEIHHFPGETRYVVTAEIPGNDTENGIIIRDMWGNITMSKDSDVRPLIKRLMIREVREHMAQVHLD